MSDIQENLGTMEQAMQSDDENTETSLDVTEAEKRADAFRKRILLSKAFRGLRETEEAQAAEETEAAETVYEAPNEPSANEVSWFQPIYKMEEENIVLSYFNEDDVFRFRIEHNHATRPLVGAVFKTPTGDELVSLNELTLPQDRFLAMTECWNSPETRRVVMVCDQNYVLENTTGQQIREAFIFLHKRQADEDREDDATACALFSMIIILVGILLALGAYLRFGGDSVHPPSV